MNLDDKKYEKFHHFAGIACELVLCLLSEQNHRPDDPYVLRSREDARSRIHTLCVALIVPVPEELSSWSTLGDDLNRWLDAFIAAKLERRIAATPSTPSPARLQTPA